MFKKTRLKVIFMLLLLFPLLTSFNTRTPNTHTPRIHYSEIPNFLHGERLTFRVRYGVITGGEMTTSVRRRWHNGHEVYHAVLTGRTTGLVDRIFRVNNVYESFFDPVTNLPRRATSNISEGNHRSSSDVSFNQEGRYVVSQRHGRVEVPPNTFDMAAVLYYIRRLDLSSLQMNEIITVDTYFGDRLFPFHIEFRGRETITIGSGQYMCLKFVPVVEVGRVFRNRDDMTIWISDDQNHIPVSIRFDIWAGSFRCDLVSWENLKYPLTSKIR